MIINWCTYYIKKGMKEIFCREMENTGLMRAYQGNALWYKFYLPIDGSDRVIAYQGWESRENIERHNTASYMARWHEIQKYYVEKIENEAYEVDELTTFSMDVLSENNKKPIAGCCTYEMYSNVREEFCRKAVTSGIYAACQKDAEHFEFLIPWDDTQEVIIMERWKDDAQMMAHCMASHVKHDLCVLKKGYVKANGCEGFRYTELTNYGIN